MATRKPVVLIDGALGELPLGDTVTGTSGQTYIHNQGAASAVWTISHALGKYPSVSTFDSAQDQIEGNVVYIDANSLTVTFSSATGGRAYLN